MRALFSDEPFWETLMEATGDDPAVKIKVRPIDRDMRSEAHAEVRKLTDVEREMRGYRVFSDHLLRLAILDWEGVGDAKGKPVPVTPQTVDLFLRDPVFGPLADEKIVVPALEKNALSRSPNGTSAGATAAKATAKTARPAAKTARTRSTR